MAKFYDTLIFELQKNGKSAASLSIKAVDLEILQNSHNSSRAETIENIILVMEDALAEKSNKNTEDKQLKLFE